MKTRLRVASDPTICSIVKMVFGLTGSILTSMRATLLLSGCRKAILASHLAGFGHCIWAAHMAAARCPGETAFSNTSFDGLSI